jgi:hypothetical protein
MTTAIDEARCIAAGERFVSALAAKDVEALRALFAPAIRFRGLTPNHEWDASDAAGALSILFDRWFEPSDHIEGVESHGVRVFLGRGQLEYCFRVRNGDGLHLVEQHVFFDVGGDGRLTSRAGVCSGFRKIDG